MTRRAARVDSNQREIDDALRALGWLVWPTHRLGDGFPDRVIAKAGRLVLLEVKDGSKPPSGRRLTPAEADAHQAFHRHGVTVLVVETVADLAQLDREARARFEGGEVRS